MRACREFEPGTLAEPLESLFHSLRKGGMVREIFGPMPGFAGGAADFLHHVRQL